MAGDDGITAEALKIEANPLLKHTSQIFSTPFFKLAHYLLISAIHNSFSKKGDKSDISNYHPISLVFHLYKAFIKVIEGRIASTLESH